MKPSDPKRPAGHFHSCRPTEVALKSFFIGPKGENGDWALGLLTESWQQVMAWRRSFYPSDGSAISRADQSLPEFVDRQERLAECVRELVGRLEGEVAKFSPRYAGHMFSEVSIPALLGHFAALLHNPNNISSESSRVGVQVENEAVTALCDMVGFPSGSCGHFTSGGTIANFEAMVRAQARLTLWGAAASLERSESGEEVASASFSVESMSGWNQLRSRLERLERAGSVAARLVEWDPSRGDARAVENRIAALWNEPVSGPVLLVPENMHYSWKKGCRIFGLGAEALWPISLDENGSLCVRSLRSQIERALEEKRPILMVVSVVGTTELGSIDPVDEVQDLLDSYAAERGIHIWHHIDAAYGGFFRTLGAHADEWLPSRFRSALRSVSRAHSITIDPHKLGYVPYSSGVVLVRCPEDYFFSAFDEAPYIDFDRGTDRGPFTLEGSRPATGAAATWLTHRSLGLDPAGLGLLIARTVRLRSELASRLQSLVPDCRIAPGAETNILVFALCLRGESTSDSNARTNRFYQSQSTRASGEFMVSKTALSFKTHGTYLRRWIAGWGGQVDTDELVLIRMCLMNPFFDSKETLMNYPDLLVDLIVRGAGLEP